MRSEMGGRSSGETMRCCRATDEQLHATSLAVIRLPMSLLSIRSTVGSINGKKRQVIWKRGRVMFLVSITRLTLHKSPNG